LTDLPPIFLLTGEFPPRVGGIADYTARLAENLRDLGLNVTVLVGSDHPAVADSAIPVEHLSSATNGWGLLRAVAERIGIRPCIVHTEYQTAAFGMHPAINLLPDWLRWRRPSARTLVTCHDVRLPYLFPKAGSLRELVTRRMIDRSHAATFADEADRQWAGAAQRHALIPIGSGVPVVPWEGKLVERDCPFRLGYFGFMNATKGVGTLLEAASRLASQGRDFRLVLIGDALGNSDRTNNETRAGIEQAISRLGLSDRIDRTGPLSLHDVSIELQRCDALVFPFDDGASFRRSSLSAALVHARPVVTTLQPTGRNGIAGFESGESVLLVPPRDAPAMANAIDRLIDDPALRARLSQGARRASERLEWPRIASAVRDVYARVMDEAGR
jgi:glycosyltransferase involved in cell wall biosynthesis